MHEMNLQRRCIWGYLQKHTCHHLELCVGGHIQTWVYEQVHTSVGDVNHTHTHSLECLQRDKLGTKSIQSRQILFEHIDEQASLIFQGFCWHNINRSNLCAIFIFLEGKKKTCMYKSNRRASIQNYASPVEHLFFLWESFAFGLSFCMVVHLGLVMKVFFFFSFFGWLYRNESNIDLS